MSTTDDKTLTTPDDGSAQAMPANDDERTTLMPDYQPTPTGPELDPGPTLAMPADDDERTTAMPPPEMAGNDQTLVSIPRETMPDTRMTPDDAPTPTRLSRPSDDTKTGSARDTVSEGKVLQQRYRLSRILGQGGFGAAYLAQDIKLNRVCVVKQMIIPPNVSPKDRKLYQANFAREANLLVQLNHPGHPNIPEIYDYFSDSGGNYLVMKYIEGQSLSEAVTQSNGKIPWREAVRYIIDVCDALNYMHSQGGEPVMHRDIKPANVLLGNDNRVWLVDFGLAKAKPVKSTGDLMATQAAGTLGYTPLEQWLGEAVPTSDVYAAGATLHYLVTGLSPSLPFGGEFNVQKLKDTHGHFSSIRNTDKSLPKTLDEVIARATAPKPDERLTALQFKQQLDALISGGHATALYTFKNGESAKTTQELVDLCDKNRTEAQSYLYGGDFERWFRMINRNDLADAATQAVKHGKHEKDGLEKFLKLIMPNLVIRRMRRVGGRLVRATLQIALILLIVLLVVIIGGSFLARGFLQQTINSADWNFNNLSLDKPTGITEAEVNNSIKAMAGAYFDDIQVDMQPPDKVTLILVWQDISVNIPAVVQLEQGKPHFLLTEINQIPLFVVADNVSAGINAGLDDAFQQSPVDIVALQISDDAATLEVAESTQSGRPALPTPTPTITPTPTPRPTPTATPTPKGLALVTIFNETGEEIVLDIEGQLYEMHIDDSKAIEVAPGTYQYTVTFKDTGAVGAEGEKIWEVKTYKWRIE